MVIRVGRKLKHEWYKTFKEGVEIIENLPHDRADQLTKKT